MTHSNDLNPFIISEDTIRQKLVSIFVDSIVIDTQYKLQVISQNILDLLGYSLQELRGRNFNFLTGEHTSEKRIQNALTSGLFEDHDFVIYTKLRKAVPVRISGFYLGLISDINGRIVLQVRRSGEVPDLQRNLRTAAIDDFIYRAAHDLRGPLATVKGLINLLKIQIKEEDRESIISLLEAHANKLDERLFQLAYLTEPPRQDTESINQISFDLLETRLRRIIEKNAFVDFLELHVNSPENRLSGIDEALFYPLCENLLYHILSQHMKANCQISYSAALSPNELKMSIAAQGFEVCDTIIDGLNQPEFSYTDLVQYPKMVNLYAARKLALQLNAIIDTTIISKDNQQINVTIPATCSPVQPT
jgi:signal transduction histidine kinase